MLRAVILTFGMMSIISSAQAADYADPTWPCIQRKVERLSLGLMWPVPEDPAKSLPADVTAQVAELADKLALRRISVEELTPDVSKFAAAHDHNAHVLGAVFADVFHRLDSRRTKIISGIAKVSLGQIALAEKIDATRAEMDTLMAAKDPDFDQVDKLEEQLDWDQEIYTDRQKSITYLCETPVLVEKRLYEVAQMLQAEMAK